MKLFFKPSEAGISKFIISNTESSDYFMEASLNFCQFYLDDSLRSQQEFLKSHFKGILNTEYSSLLVKTGATNSYITFAKHHIDVELIMDESKFFRFREELRGGKMADVLIRIELSEEELGEFPSREGIEDNLKVPIKFKNYSIEFSHE